MRKTKILTAILFALVVVALSATASAESCPRLAYEYEQEHILERIEEERERSEQEKLDSKKRKINVTATVSQSVKRSAGNIGSEMSYSYYVNGRNLSSGSYSLTVREGDSVLLTAIIKEQDEIPDIGRKDDEFYISDSVMDRLEAGEKVSQSFLVKVQENNGTYAGSYRTYRVTFTFTPESQEPVQTVETSPKKDPTEAAESGEHGDMSGSSVAGSENKSEDDDSKYGYKLLIIAVIMFCGVYILGNDGRDGCAVALIGCAAVVVSIASIIVIGMESGIWGIVLSLLAVAAVFAVFFGAKRLIEYARERRSK